MNKTMPAIVLVVVLLVGWFMFHNGMHGCCSIDHDHVMHHQ